MSKRVLIIDEEAESQRNLSVGLTREGFVCTSCSSGISAIHELSLSIEKGIPYHYLISDIFIRDLDGFKMIQVIKRKYPSLPVVVITRFGDEELKQKILTQPNAAYLEKPFTIPDLIREMNKLKPGDIMQDMPLSSGNEEVESKVEISCYLNIRIIQPELSKEIYDRLSSMEGIASCEAVRGDMDIIILLKSSSEDHLQALLSKIQAISGMEILSISPVERPRLDRDIRQFIQEYEKIKVGEKESLQKHPGTSSYLWMDIDPQQIQNIFTGVYFNDSILSCDVIDNGTKLVALFYGSESENNKILAKLKQIDGILRIREARIIK